MRRRRRIAGITDEMLLARLMDAERELAARALRRHRVWREAVERGASSRAQRALRRAWERARDEALIELGAAETSRSRHASPGRGRPKRAADHRSAPQQ